MNNSLCDVVGVGTSAGGIEALKRFFSSVKPGGGVAYVVVPHVSPDHKSMMAEILSKYTSLDVCQVYDGIEIQPDRVYLLPPGAEMTIAAGVLRLEPRGDRHQFNYPIDRFFTSLARERADRSVAVILSGTGSDGTRGAGDVRRAGGMVLAQDGTAQFDGMPASASAAGVVDRVMGAELMAEDILRFVNLKRASPDPSCLLPEEDIGAIKRGIFKLLSDKYQVDFSYYKQNSIIRRIERRMGLHHLSELRDYRDLLASDPQEITSLWKELLINVTRFFRDQEAFGILRDQIVPRLFREPRPSIRIWVAGCSTGEEAYSIAMLMSEYMEAEGIEVPVKIFATDLDKEALDHAGIGVYGAEIAADITPERLSRYFDRKGESYQVKKEIRKMVVFARHNMIRDPAFLHMDMVVCRNVMIYFQPPLQKKVLSTFHYALQPNGILFLGASESIGDLTKLYTSMQGKWNIFCKKESHYPNRELNFSQMNDMLKLQGESSQHQLAPLEEYRAFRKPDDVSASLIDEFVPPCVIVDENLDIVHTTGNTNQLLQVPKGRFTNNLLKMLPQPLAVAVSTAVVRAKKENTEVLYKSIAAGEAAGRRIHLKIKPFRTEKTEGKYTLIAFITDQRGSSEDLILSAGRELDMQDKQFILDLEQELISTQETLQSVVEQLETSNEELQATNEELIASNEELQSANEELSSVNEELVTLNAEYQSKILELIEVNNDINNFLTSSNIGTIFLDNDLCVRRFTEGITDVINLMEIDIGRPIAHISHNLHYDHLLADIEDVLRTLVSIEKEVQSRQGCWYLFKISPYRTADNYIKGIILTIVDITELKAAHSQLSKLRLAVEQSPSAVVIMDVNFVVEYVNPLFTRLTGYAPEQVIGRKLGAYENLEPADVYEGLWERLASEGTWKGEIQGETADGQVYWELATILPIMNENREILHYLKLSEDITQKKVTENLLRKSEMLSVAGQLASGIAHEIRNPLTSVKGFLKLMLTNAEDRDKYLEILTSEVDSMEMIINELLLLAKTQVLEFKSVDIRTILQNVVMLLSSQAILKNIEFIVESEMDSVFLNGVENQLRQLFVNVLKNAIEATPEGGHILIQVKMKDAAQVAIRIIDHGTGIPPEQLKRLGEPFYTTKQKGTGLGLMICYQIINNHQGHIEFRSKLGQGTTVEIALPLIETQIGFRRLPQAGAVLFKA